MTHMSIADEHITQVVHSTVQALSVVLPAGTLIGEPERIKPPVHQSELGSVIGLAGDVRGQFICSTRRETARQLGSDMFGMPLDKDMVESFVSELSNMISGHIASDLAHRGLMIDITPPIVLVGEVRLYEPGLTIRVPVKTGNGDMAVVIVLEGGERSKWQAFSSSTMPHLCV